MRMANLARRAILATRILSPAATTARISSDARLASPLLCGAQRMRPWTWSSAAERTLSNATPNSVAGEGAVTEGRSVEEGIGDETGAGAVGAEEGVASAEKKYSDGAKASEVIGEEETVFAEKKDCDEAKVIAEEENADREAVMASEAIGGSDEVIVKHEGVVASEAIVEEGTETGGVAENVALGDKKPAKKKAIRAQKGDGRKRNQGQEEDGTTMHSTAAQISLHIKTAIREFQLGKIPNARVGGLPGKRSLITVLRGPHIDKKSREQFDVQTRKWLVGIDTETHKLREKLDFLKEHRIPGVEIKAKFYYKTRLAWPLKPTGLSDSDKWKLYNLSTENPNVFTVARLAADFQLEEQQVYNVLRSMGERTKHKALFGD